MDRKEALLALEGKLIVMDTQIKDGMSYKEKADEILKFLKQLGMQPPLHYFKDKDGKFISARREWGDLFKDTSHKSKNIIVTKYGIRSSLSVEEILENERKDSLDETSESK